MTYSQFLPPPAYKAILVYDGTRYFGWQKTSTGPSIQEEVEKAIFQITKERQIPEAASRTDRGVHARGQVIQFSLQNPFEPHKLQKALNAVLPTDIRIQSLEFHEFHPTLDAIGKEYHYHLSLIENPIQRLYSWYFRYPLDLKKMQQEAKHLIGTHDFTAFANEPEKNPICTLHSIELINSLTIQIRGDRFLYKMVRNLVGTLVYIGCGKLFSIEPILASKDRKRAGMTAPAHGLYLHQVFYPLN